MTKIQVLDHGFVELVDHMGDDRRIVEAARVSYGSESGKSSDAALIDLLIANGHTSPLEHVVFEFRCRMPIFVARQWARHRTARINEVSGRYTDLPQEFYSPGIDRIGHADLLNQLKELQSKCYWLYQDMLDAKIPREVARTVLPLSLYTEWFWQMDLHNLLSFLRQRLSSHAQYEIRVYAQAILKVIEPIVPMAIKSFIAHNGELFKN